jgi:predicted transposase YbfD/YdcC
MNDITKSLVKEQAQEGWVFSVHSLVRHLHQLHDPRAARGKRYEIVDLLVLIILAKLGGEDTLKGIAEWVQVRAEALKRLLGLSWERMPHATTYARLLARLNVKELEYLIGRFFALGIQDREGREIVVALDGKVLRGTIPPAESQGVVLLAAYVPEQGVAVMQVEVEGGGDEAVVAPRVLSALNLQGVVVTGDAMYTERALCEQIVAQGGDYLFPVKGDHPSMRQDIVDMFSTPPLTPGHNTAFPSGLAQSWASGHGRIDHYYLFTSSALNTYLDWPHLGQVFMLLRVSLNQRTRRLSLQATYGVTSLLPERCSPDRLLELLRSHWHIENRLHYVRDVSLHEDTCPVRSSRIQRVLAALNNLVIGLIRRCDAFRYIPEARRFFAVHFDQAFQLLIT